MRNKSCWPLWGEKQIFLEERPFFNQMNWGGWRTPSHFWPSQVDHRFFSTCFLLKLNVNQRRTLYYWLSWRIHLAKKWFCITKCLSQAIPQLKDLTQGVNFKLKTTSPLIFCLIFHSNTVIHLGPCCPHEEFPYDEIRVQRFIMQWAEQVQADKGILGEWRMLNAKEDTPLMSSWPFIT